MLFLVRMRERGATPRKLWKVLTQAKRDGWLAVGKLFHEKFRPRRFTTQHAIKAGYKKRKGDDLPFGTKAFWRSYVGQKLTKKKHRLPLVWSGTTRDRARTANIANTSQGVKVKYSLNVLNFIPWAREEFEKILPDEVNESAAILDKVIDDGLKKE